MRNKKHLLVLSTTHLHLPLKNETRALYLVWMLLQKLHMGISHHDYQFDCVRSYHAHSTQLVEYLHSALACYVFFLTGFFAIFFLALGFGMSGTGIHLPIDSARLSIILSFSYSIKEITIL